MAKRKKDADLSPDKGYLERTAVNLMGWEELVPAPDAEVVLAADPGTENLALCLLTSRRGVHSVITSKIAMPKFKTKESKIQYVGAVVQAWIKEYNPEIFIKEGPIYPGSSGKPGQPNFLLFGLIDSGKVQAVLENAAFMYGKPLMTIPPTTMRAFLGSKSKSDNKLQIYKRYGIEVPSEDEADSVGLAFCAMAIARGEYVIKKAVKKSRKKKVAE